MNARIAAKSCGYSWVAIGVAAVVCCYATNDRRPFVIGLIYVGAGTLLLVASSVRRWWRQ